MSPRQSTSNKGKGRAVSARPSPKPSTSATEGAPTLPSGGFYEDTSRFAVVTARGNSYEMATTTTAVHTPYEGNEGKHFLIQSVYNSLSSCIVSPTSLESTMSSTDKIVFRTIYTPDSTIQKIFDALLKAPTRRR